MIELLVLLIQHIQQELIFPYLAEILFLQQIQYIRQVVELILMVIMKSATLLNLVQTIAEVFDRLLRKLLTVMNGLMKVDEVLHIQHEKELL